MGLILNLLMASAAAAPVCNLDAFSKAFQNAMKKTRSNAPETRAVGTQRVEYQNPGERFVRTEVRELTHGSRIYQSEEALRMAKYNGGENAARRGLANGLRLRASDNMVNGNWNKADGDLRKARDHFETLVAGRKIKNPSDRGMSRDLDLETAFDANVNLGDASRAADLVQSTKYGEMAVQMQTRLPDFSDASRLEKENPIALMNKYRTALNIQRTRVELFTRAIKENGAPLQSGLSSANGDANAIQKAMEALARSLD